MRCRCRVKAEAAGLVANPGEMVVDGNRFLKVAGMNKLEQHMGGDYSNEHYPHYGIHVEGRIINDDAMYLVN
jgi:hypothetical protein